MCVACRDMSPMFLFFSFELLKFATFKKISTKRASEAYKLVKVGLFCRGEGHISFIYSLSYIIRWICDPA